MFILVGAFQTGGIPVSGRLWNGVRAKSGWALWVRTLYWRPRLKA